ncbi:MAG: 50S ribosomal protein L21e, partial [Candidatus Poseidoniales archaeon]
TVSTVAVLIWGWWVGNLLRRGACAELERLEAKNMKRSKGQRVGTRSILRRRKNERSRLNIRRVMHQYEEGDRVAIVLDGGQQGGMPHRRFHGRTGFITKRQGVAWIVAVKDGNMQKTVIARPEHLRPLE